MGKPQVTFQKVYSDDGILTFHVEIGNTDGMLKLLDFLCLFPKPGPIRIHSEQFPPDRRTIVLQSKACRRAFAEGVLEGMREGCGSRHPAFQ